MRTRYVGVVRGLPVLIVVGLAALLCLAPAMHARAEMGGIDVYIKAGKPTELQADGKSRTTLVVEAVDLSHSCWGGPVSGDGTFTLLVGAKNATVQPNNKVDIRFPADLTVTAGTESGVADIKLMASWCPKGAVGAFGVCTDQVRGQAKCEAEISIPIGDAAPAPPPDPAKPPEEKPDASAKFGVTVACAAKKPEGDKSQAGKLEEGQPLVCTAAVQGARPKETFQYIWYVDGTQMATTTTPTWTWDKATAGYHEIGLDISSNDDPRSEKGDTSVDIPAAAQSPAQPAQPPAQPAQPPAQPAQPPAQPA